MLDTLKEMTLYAAAFVEAVAMLVITIAVLGILYNIIKPVMEHRHTRDTVENARLNLGRWLVLSLELLVAADILRTAVAPTWNEIGQLGAIVLLRVLLNYSLERDIERAARATGETAG